MKMPGALAIDVALTFAYVPPDRVIMHAQDITTNKQAQIALEYQARHDALTGLPNRGVLNARLREGIARARTALLILDLDRFKDVNDTLGHAAGDVLLHEMAARLDRTLQSSDVQGDGGPNLAARLGGDEFAVVLENIDAVGATRIAHLLLDAVRTPVDLDGHLVSTEASVGVALSPDHASDAESLLRRADVAMYAAKSGRLGVCVYAAEQDQHDPRRLEFVADLRTAIEHDQLVLHFQPQVD